jgi:hypothetical protein
VKAADPRLLFILTEIELGITFVQRALTAYQLGYEEHGHSAKANAIKALESAKRFIGDLDPANCMCRIAKVGAGADYFPILGREGLLVNKGSQATPGLIFLLMSRIDQSRSELSHRVDG